MEGKQMLDRVLVNVDEDKHAELIEKLQLARSQSEVLELVKEYGIDENSENVMPIWFSDSYELSDEMLDMVAGGAPWDNSIDTNCCY